MRGGVRQFCKKKYILIRIVIITFLIAGYYAFINPYRGTVSFNKMEHTLSYDQSVTKEQALADLEYMVKRIEERHLSAQRGLLDKVQQQYDLEIKNMPESPVVLDLWRAGSRIIKQLEDAHASVSYRTDDGWYINIALKVVDNQWVCAKGPRAGQKVESINGVNIDTLYTTFLSQFSYENIYYAEYSFPNYLKRKHMLNWLGVNPSDTVEVTFEHDGALETETYTFEKIPASTPVQDFVRYTIDKEKKVGILTLYSCRYNEEYKKVLHDFFTEVKRLDIQTVAVDLRRNSGGNSTVADEFVKYLPVDSYMNFGAKIRYGPWVYVHKVGPTKNEGDKDLVFDGDVYVLTSKATFSSATWFSVLLHDNGLAKVIGEPSGNKPSAYGDVLTFQMPHSKLPFTLTYKEFSRPDVSKDKEEALLPDYWVEQEKALEELYKITFGSQK